MKSTMKLLVSIAFTLILALGLIAQEEQPVYIAITKVHWDLNNKDFDADKWMAMQKEYHEKVTMKNELILATEFLDHYYTGDNSEVQLITVYPSWEAIESAVDRGNQLIELAWPDKVKREAFLKEMNSAYDGRYHSDEIYVSVPGAKPYINRSDESVVVYLRKSHISIPDDGNNEELAAMRKEFVDNVIRKNELILGYYPQRHLWGSDGRDFLEGFLVKDLGGIDAMANRNTELIEAHWPDEVKRKEFFKKMNKYFSGWHGDYIYRNYPELAKNTPPPPPPAAVKKK